MDKLFKNCGLSVRLAFINTLFLNSSVYCEFNLNPQLTLFNLLATNFELLFAPIFNTSNGVKSDFYTHSTPTTTATIFI